MDLLPRECLEHIFSFLSVKQLFSCRRVCRSWDTVARHLIRQQQSLVFQVDDYFEDVAYPPRRLCPKNCVNVSHYQRTGTLSSLLVMHQLKSLDIGYPSGIDARISELVRRNAATLERLHLIGVLPKDVSFPRLRELVCHDAPSTQSCPSLVKLVLRFPRISAGLLVPNPTGLRFYSYRATFPPMEAQSFNALVEAVRRMVNLETLHLILLLSRHVQPDHLIPLIRCMRHLRQLEVCLGGFYRLYSGQLILEILACCPDLVHLSLLGMSLSDVSLRTIARAANLEFLELADDDSFVSAAGVLDLLRGASRLTLRCLRLEFKSLDWLTKQVEAEVRLMAQETGRSLQKDLLSNGLMVQFAWSSERLFL